MRTPSHFGSYVKSGESNGSSALLASIGSILRANGSSEGAVPCMIMSQSRPSWAVVCTITYSPVSLVPWNAILYSPRRSPVPGFSSSRS